MFSIIILLILALIILIIAFNIKAVIKADNVKISVSIYFLAVIRINKNFIIKYEDKTFLALYEVTKKGLKEVITFPEIIRKITKAELKNITFTELITTLARSLRKKEKGVFYYIYRRIKYDVGAQIKLGLGDAFITAIGCGLINAAAGTAGAVCNTKYQVFRIRSYPEFSKQFFSIQADCIITLSPADIIIGYAIYIKNKRR